MAQHNKNKQQGFKMDPEMRAASYMAGTPAFKLEKIPEDATGIKKLVKSEKGREAVKNMGYDPATAMKPAYAMGNLYNKDNLRNERGVITPSAMRLDPGGFFTDFKVETPKYLKDAGYGYNPDQTYNFTFSDKDGKMFRTNKLISQDEYDAGGYTLKGATYRPIQNKDINIGMDTKGYNRQKPVTTKLPSDFDSQEAANRRNNPYLSQYTRFGNKDGKTRQLYTTNMVSQGFKPTVKYDDDGNRFKTFKRTGASSYFTTKPGESGPSNVMNFDSFRFENKYNPQTFNFTRRFRNVGDEVTPKNPTYSVNRLGVKVSNRSTSDQRLFSQAVGPGMRSILEGLTFTSKKSGEQVPKFKLRIN